MRVDCQPKACKHGHESTEGSKMLGRCGLKFSKHWEGLGGPEACDPLRTLECFRVLLRSETQL